MKRKIFALVICLVLVMAMPLTASADMGPKPSVRITFTGIEGETYYGTLLSLRKSTSPSSAWDGNPEYAQYHPEDEGYEIWLKSSNTRIRTGIISCRNGGIVLNPIS